MTVFRHADIWHLAGNLVGLAMFGPRVARTLGVARAVLLASFAGELANRAAAAMIDRPVIGASAAVFALAGAWLALFPHDRAARAGVALLIALQAVFATAALDFGGVAWCAHIIGAVLGWFFAKCLLSAQRHRRAMM
ncbi:MAG: hypothetical protein DI597_00720 [Pseudoxanthomonas spadix]|nr:MAG: hypothetical protein DI597_00720 [Pseudoxanthomonas spadix]